MPNTSSFHAVTGRLANSSPTLQDIPRANPPSALRQALKRMARLTPYQEVLLRTANIHGTVLVAGQRLTESALRSYIFEGKKPETEELATELGLHAPLINIDLSALERRALAGTLSH